MNDLSTILTTIETAQARIGCPPGDNADADLYRDLQRAHAALSRLEASAEEPVELSDADIDRMVYERRLRQEQNPTCVSVTQDGIGYRDALRHITKHHTLYPKQP